MGKQEILQAAYDAIQECGWMPDGTTTGVTVKMPTIRGPKLATFPSRQRFRKMDWFVTIGPKTTNFYQRGKDGPENLIQVRTSDVEGIRKLANEKGR